MNRYRYVRKTKKIIEHEKDRSEQLLLNVLPAETAEELKEKGSATPKHYDMVTVLFTDFKGFTRIAEKLTPAALVAELDYCFHAFDKIIDKHKIEKIKTIGDAYMCAGGIPVANTSNPADVVRAGIEIREFMEQLKIEKEARGEDYWELRIGIHTGSVIAGVVGKNKFAYDIWGDAVNLASRMESSGIPGKVNISGNTYELVKDLFRCTFRGQIQAKNKGEIDMYIVEEPANQQLENAAYTSVAGMDKSLRLN
jgi:class 3 adenylate cyclase